MPPTMPPICADVSPCGLLSWPIMPPLLKSLLLLEVGIGTRKVLVPLAGVSREVYGAGVGDWNAPYDGAGGTRTRTGCRSQSRVVCAAGSGARGVAGAGARGVAVDAGPGGDRGDHIDSGFCDENGRCVKLGTSGCSGGGGGCGATGVVGSFALAALAVGIGGTVLAGRAANRVAVNRTGIGPLGKLGKGQRKGLGHGDGDGIRGDLGYQSERE
jgi:hypothetical protein